MVVRKGSVADQVDRIRFSERTRSYGVGGRGCIKAFRSYSCAVDTGSRTFSLCQPAVCSDTTRTARVEAPRVFFSLSRGAIRSHQRGPGATRITPKTAHHTSRN